MIGITCTAAGCEREGVLPCTYIDRHGGECGTAWCEQHRVGIHGKIFCRRHAGTIRALQGTDDVRATLPDVRNRAPSLVQWVVNDLDMSMRTVLNNQLTPGSDEAVGFDPVHLARRFENTRVWQASWKIFDHTGIICRVTVAVDEKTDPLLSVGVGQRDVISQVPPWIAHRNLGRPEDPQRDAKERMDFYASILRTVHNAVAEELAAAARFKTY